MSEELAAWLKGGSLLKEAGKKGGFSSAAVDRAYRALAASDPWIVMEGCVVLLEESRDGIAESLLTKIESLATAPSYVKCNLLLSLGSLPNDILAARRILKEMIFESLSDLDSRLNAAILVGRLASFGDPEAVAVYAKLEAAPDKEVFSNARIAFEKDKKGAARGLL